ncbi:MAG: hypothetical protein IT381_10425 [Deltaproteobacteria bacterium]|nr:hypothetical protein [Deltaproteobacteria bacterium]
MQEPAVYDLLLLDRSGDSDHPREQRIMTLAWGNDAVVVLETAGTMRPPFLTGPINDADRRRLANISTSSTKMLRRRQTCRDFLRDRSWASDRSAVETFTAVGWLMVLQETYESWLGEISQQDPFEDMKPAQRLLGNLHRELVALAFRFRDVAPRVAAAADERAEEALHLAARTQDVPGDEEELTEFCAGIWNQVDELVSGLAEAPEGLARR